MLLIPEQVQFLRKSIVELQEELEGYSTYLENRGVSNIESSRRVQVLDSITDNQYVAKQDKLKEYQNLLSKSECVKNISTEEIGIGTRFKIRFDGEEQSEGFILVDSLIGSNLSLEAVTIESELGKSIYGKKEGESFSYTPRSNCTITGVIEKIEKENDKTFIRSRKISKRMGRTEERELKELKSQIYSSEEARIAYDQRMELSKSQLELLEEELEILSAQVPKDINKKATINRRIQTIKKLIETRKIAQLPTDGTIGVGTAFSIMFFGDQRVTTRRVEMINQAVGNELTEDYVERISPLGSKIYGLKEQEEFMIMVNGYQPLTGMVYDIDNQLERVETRDPLVYQKRRKG
ncbi:MAG: hypothetical protein HFG40_04170 [Bacilli bacterium]|nr:hypothetical protein [Bacilli bacterium]